MQIIRRTRRQPVISMIPLINVVFLLLIFFLVAGTVEKIDVIDVELPEAVSGELADTGPVEVLLGRHDEIIINDRPVAFDALGEAVAELLADQPDRLITLKADARMDAPRMIQVMDAIKQAGGVNLALTTQRL